MAGKTIEMSKIKQAIQWFINGKSRREIATLVSMNKETVNNYIAKAIADPMPLENLVRLDDEDLCKRLQGGNAAYPDERFEELKKLMPYFVEQMSDRKKHMTLQLLWEEYRLSHPDGYGISQFRYHYSQHVKSAKLPSTVLADMHEPGEKLYIDFAGDTMSYIDVETGEVVRVQVFVAVLPYSNYAFAMAVPSQSQDDFVYALRCCLEHLGGCPKILVPDNLKAAVIRADRNNPDINRLMEDFANHYGAVVLPTRVRHPKDKANVEGAVRILYNRVYAPLRNMEFHSIEELNVAISEHVMKHNQKRMQLKDYTREEQFLSSEKPTLRPLPPEPFEILCRTRLKLQFNNFFLLGCDKHYYSAPYALIGQDLDIVYTRTLVKAYDSQHNCVAVHARVPNRRGGGYTYKNEHLASHSLEYRSRSMDKYIAQARRLCPDLADFMEGMYVSGSHPEEVYFKRWEALIAKAKNTSAVLMQRACAHAIRLQNFSYQFVMNIIASKGAGLPDESAVPKAPAPVHENIRGAGAYA